MTQQAPDKRTHQDPLLEFALEHAQAEAPAVQEVAAVPDAPVPPPDPLVPLIARVDRLERSIERMTTQVKALTSEVATIVNARKHKPAPSSYAIVPAAIGVAGLVAATWFWSYSTEVSPQPAPLPIEATVSASTIGKAPDAVIPVTPAAPAAVEKAPAPSAAPIRDAPVRTTPRRIDYLGTLSIDALPEAEVFINRKPAGRTPVRLTDLKAGSHLVWLQRDGFRRFTRVVQVPADRVTRVSATLDPVGTR